MSLLKTLVLPNALAVHSLDNLAIYQDGEVRLYRKNDSDNSIALLNTFPLAGVKRLAISENGRNLCAQTSTQVYRLTQEGASPLDVTGQMAVSNLNYLVVLLPSAVQIIRETTVNLSATTYKSDRVVCGLSSFIVYNATRYLTGTFGGITLTNTPAAKSIRFITHVGNDKFAIFYADGSVSYNGDSKTFSSMGLFRESGRHLIAKSGTDAYAYQKSHPLAVPIRLRAWGASDPSTDWWSPEDLVAFDSTIFNSAGFTDFNGKIITPYSANGNKPFKASESFQFGAGIDLNTNGGIFQTAVPGAELTRAFTIDFWFKESIDGGVSALCPIYTNTAASGSGYLQVSPHDTQQTRMAAWSNNAGANAISSWLTFVASTTWRHLAITYSGTTMSIYLDGVLLGILTFTIQSFTTAWGLATRGIWRGADTASRVIVERYRVRSGALWMGNFDINGIYDR